mmetsp:Transcript_53267/g.97401  ORF Transcript_53267/g.97401 Transcript_53267/m.97401 type:complete len:217 (-) Transcript_53267:629-1279(-)
MALCGSRGSLAGLHCARMSDPSAAMGWELKSPAAIGLVSALPFVHDGVQATGHPSQTNLHLMCRTCRCWTVAPHAAMTQRQASARCFRIPFQLLCYTAGRSHRRAQAFCAEFWCQDALQHSSDFWTVPTSPMLANALMQLLLLSCPRPLWRQYQGPKPGSLPASVSNPSLLLGFCRPVWRSNWHWRLFVASGPFATRLGSETPHIYALQLLHSTPV